MVAKGLSNSFPPSKKPAKSETEPKVAPIPRIRIKTFIWAKCLWNFGKILPKNKTTCIKKPNIEGISAVKVIANA